MRIVAGILVIVTALLAACGQKGPLYLPPPQPAPQSSAPIERTEPTRPTRPADRPYPDVPATTDKQ